MLFTHFSFRCIYNTKNLEITKLFNIFNIFHAIEYYVVIKNYIFKGFLNDGNIHYMVSGI